MMEPLTAVVRRVAGSSEGIARKNLTEKIKRMAYLEEPVKIAGDKPIEALFYYAARSLYQNDSREAAIRAMEMRRLELAFEAAEKLDEANRRLLKSDAWKNTATEDARAKIRKKAAGREIPESWEELAIRIADVLDNVPEARGEEEQ